MTALSPYAFIFNADHKCLRSIYGYPILNQVFLSLFESDAESKVRSRIHWGDIFLPGDSHKISEINISKFKNNSTYKFDKHMHMSLVVRFAEEIGQQWSSIDTKIILDGLLKHNTCCITFPTLDRATAIKIDNRLKANLAYYGVLEIDLGNIVQYDKCLRSLPEFCYFKNRTVYFENTEGVGNNSFWLADFKKQYPDNIIILPTEDYRKNIPDVSKCHQQSLSGKKTLKVYEAKGTLTEHQNVLELLRGSKRNIDLNLVAPLSEGIHTFILDKKKFVEYLLNEKHRKGGGKANFFNEQLGIYKDDWRFLLAQFYYGIKNSVARKIDKIDEYGIRYEMYLPVIGRNKKIKSVKVCWLVQNEKIKLTSAMPDSDNKANLSKPIVPPIIDDRLPKFERWQKIYDLAIDLSNRAISICVPTPMIVEQETISDGLCGGAYVLLPDARSSFARWLKKNKFGETEYSSGFAIFINSKTQSRDKAKAGAEAFAEVLILNGIDCTVRDYLT
ncbi:MAG: hypothetical protein A2Y12_03950 [Planctomycetes bacterium GWF2_42_9]|nr:MAG: hypothetical protein A2Y12_03950 [Planctomycetes bacterium GWF2_42_9]